MSSRYINIFLFILLVSASYGQFSITLKYQKPKCGGARNIDTKPYFLLTNKKWIIQHPNKKIDTIYTNVQGKIKIPNKKGTYYLYEPWKFYHQNPADFPMQLYDKKCLEKEWSNPDFTIIISSNKKYKIIPKYLKIYCPDKHPCLRNDTIIPHIPYH